MAAALAFHTIFAIAPLFVIVLAIGGFVFGEQAASRELFSQVSGLVGSEGGGSDPGARKRSPQIQDRRLGNGYRGGHAHRRRNRSLRSAPRRAQRDLGRPTAAGSRVAQFYQRPTSVLRSYCGHWFPSVGLPGSQRGIFRDEQIHGWVAARA